MLELALKSENTWVPPLFDEQKVMEMCKGLPMEQGEIASWLIITKTNPYVDCAYVQFSSYGMEEPKILRRFVFHPEYHWEWEDEEFFENYCLQGTSCRYVASDLDEVYAYFSKLYPEWQLQRYHNKRLRILDHLYHCMIQNTMKEMLYKAGIDYHAIHCKEIDEVNLLSTKPAELYDGVPMRILRALNCDDGAKLLLTSHNREFLKALQSRFPDIFKKKFNDAQSRYLGRLMAGNLTKDEVGRLFQARFSALMQIWSYSQYELFLSKEKGFDEFEKLKKLDPIYEQCLSKKTFEEYNAEMSLANIKYYLLYRREEMDRSVRRSNRKRPADWQERDKKFVIRYPQTINDFCREAVYMSNCLMTYAEAMINNDTTILFLRKAEDVNKPFVTIEIYQNELRQAYRRFNADCQPEEAEWIVDFCNRHGIDASKFHFDKGIDLW